MVTSSSSPVRWPADSVRAARLYLITPARPDLDAFLEAAIRGGVDLVQLRDKRLADGPFLEALREARDVTRRLGVPLVVNDRPDLALLVRAEAVHVGQDDLPVEEARRFGLPVGLSAHTQEQIDAGRADYLGVGPIFETPTKAGRAAVGLELVRYAAARANAPWFAIGGIDRTNAEQVVAAGAERIAVVRAIGQADDPEAAARSLRDVLPRDPAQDADSPPGP